MITIRNHIFTLAMASCGILLTEKGNASPDSQLDGLKVLVEAKRYDEAKVQADNLRGQLAAESASKKKELNKASIDDDWKKVASLAEELKANERRQKILEFLSDKIEDPKLPESERERFADVAVNSLDKVEETPLTIFDSIEAAGFKLSRTADDSSPDFDKPALFGLTHNYENGSDTEYAADFFLSWSPNRIRGAGRGPQIIPGEESLYELSVEGHLNSANEEAADAWKIRAERNSKYDLPGNGHFIDLDIGAKLEADRDFDRQRLSGEIQISATWWQIGMGRFIPAADVLIDGKKPEAEAPVEFRWRPYLTIDIGDTIRGEQAPDSVVWTAGKVKGELSLNFVKEALGVEGVSLFADWQELYSADEGDWHSYFETGIDVMFTKNVGWSAIYKDGESSPDFEPVGLFTTGVTVKF